MSTYLLTWNPAKWPWDDLDECIQAVRQSGVYSDRWSCGHSRKIVEGDRVFLIRQGQEPRGIVGSGWVASPVFDDQHWDEAKQTVGKRAWYILVDFDVLLDADREPILPRAQLNVGVLGSMHWDTQTSGIVIPNKVASRLEVEWKRLLNGRNVSLRGVPKARRGNLS
jgi:5-methylcytosine-specific restriction protein A